MGVTRKGSRYLIDWRDENGTRRRKSYPSKKEAERANRAIRRYKKGEGPRPRGFKLLSLIQDWLSTKASLAAAKLHNYRRATQILLPTQRRA